MKIKVNSFCSVSRHPAWHAFLGRVSPDILEDLKVFLRTNTGCKSARIKMVEIYQKLYARGKDSEFEDFIRQQFPYMEEHSESNTKSCAVRPKPKPRRKKIAKQENLNRHGVFKSYQPSLLTFPHRLILVDNNDERLLKSVSQFLSDKIKIDYIIIEDRAYVEYLLPKYAEVQNKLRPEALEIEQYRRRNSQ
jgi:hypothetical protein